MAGDCAAACGAFPFEEGVGMILGIDFSLTATGVCAITDGEAETTTIGASPREWWQFGDRVREIADGIDKWQGDEDRPALVLESPSFGSSGRGHDMVLVGWHMLVDHLVFELGYEPPLRVAPSQIKKFMLGKGSGKGVTKTAVAIAAGRRYPDVPIGDDNQADALVLAAIGAAALGEPFNGSLLKYQEEVVAAVAAGKGK